MAQNFSLFGQVFSTVEHVTLVHKVHDRSSEEHIRVDRKEWLELVSTKSLSRILSRCLRSKDEEISFDLLPELQELTYSGRGDNGDCIHLIHRCSPGTRLASHPITLTHR